MVLPKHKVASRQSVPSSHWLAQARQFGEAHSKKLGNSINDKITTLAIENSSKLGGFIFSRVKDVALSQDIFQQSLMIAYKNYANFRGDSSDSTWLIGISRNLIRNHFSRSPEYNYTFVSPDVLTTTRSNARTPEQEAEMRETLEQVHKEIKKLPTKLRQVVDAVVLKEHSYKQVSRDLKVSSGTVRSRLSRARIKLRQALRGDPAKR